MMLLYMLSAGTALIIASLVIVLLLLRAVGLLERIANAIERQNPTSDVVRATASGNKSGQTPPPVSPPDS
jgi:hypothetical protein